MDLQKLSQGMFKYLFEGLAVALAAFYIPKKGLDMMDVLMIAATAAVTFLVLDMFSPTIGASARIGAGLGIGAKAVGFERFEGEEMEY